MLKKNEIYEIEITSYTSDGNGVGRVNSIAVFVPCAAMGDKLLVKIIKTAKSYAVGKIEKIIKGSPYRQKSPCEFFNMCGGCSFMHVNYEHQAEIKKQHVSDCLLRIGGFSDVTAESTLKAENSCRYRNKMVFPLGEKNGMVTGGFYANKSHRIITLSDCLLGDKIASDALRAVVDFANEHKISAYNEETHKGILRRFMVRTAQNTGEAMAVISVNSENLPKSEELVKALLSLKNEKYSFTSIILNINKGKNNLVLGDENITLYGKNTITDVLAGLKFEISPNSFFQVNPKQTEKLYALATEFADLNGSETVLDLYCGAGTISLCCAKKAKKVIGVEVVKAAIKNAKSNAKANNIKNAEFILGEAEKIAPHLSEKQIKPDVVIFDPPRKGLDKNAINAVGKMNPKKIVYVSCNPSSLARDLKLLAEFGYAIKRVKPVDMFPNTAHVETVVLLSRL